MMKRQDLFDALDFDNEFTLHDEVGPEGTWQVDTIVGNSHRYLFLVMKAQSPHFERKARLVHRLVQPGAQLLMHSNRASDDGIRSVVGNKGHALAGAKVSPS